MEHPNGLKFNEHIKRVLESKQNKYFVQVIHLDGLKLGMAQNRKRIFYLGIKKDILNVQENKQVKLTSFIEEFLKTFEKNSKTLKEVISDLPIAPDLVYSVMEQFVPLESWPCDIIGCRHEAKHFFSNDDDKLNSLCIICFAEQVRASQIRLESQKCHNFSIFIIHLAHATRKSTTHSTAQRLRPQRRHEGP